MLRLIILFLILLIPDLYVFTCVMADTAWYWKVLLSLPSVAYFVVLWMVMKLGDIRQSMLNLFFALLLCPVVATILFSVVSLLGSLCGLIWKCNISAFYISGIVLVGIWLVICGYGLGWGWKRIVINRKDIVFPKLPRSFNGYKIVHISDLHIGTYKKSPECVRNIVDAVNSLQPDVIFFTGDLINKEVSEINGFIDILRRLHATDGIYSVLGNHDFCRYRIYRFPDSPLKEFERLTEIQKSLGWKLLRNESVTILRGNDKISVIGVDYYSPRTRKNSTLTDALNGVDRHNFKILLTHDPSHWRAEVTTSFFDISLTLSGHTHAMQFKIGRWSPARWRYREWGGLYRQSEQYLFVSQGIGENVAFRFGAYPEIGFITLKNT